MVWNQFEKKLGKKEKEQFVKYKTFDQKQKFQHKLALASSFHSNLEGM